MVARRGQGGRRVPRAGLAASDARRPRHRGRVSTGAPLVGKGDRDGGRGGARGVRVLDSRAAEGGRGGLSDNLASRRILKTLGFAPDGPCEYKGARVERYVPDVGAWTARRRHDSSRARSTQ